MLDTSYRNQNVDYHTKTTQDAGFSRWAIALGLVLGVIPGVVMLIMNAVFSNQSAATTENYKGRVSTGAPLREQHTACKVADIANGNSTCAKRKRRKRPTPSTPDRAPIQSPSEEFQATNTSPIAPSAPSRKDIADEANRQMAGKVEELNACGVITKKALLDLTKWADELSKWMFEKLHDHDAIGQLQENFATLVKCLETRAEYIRLDEKATNMEELRDFLKGVKPEGVENRALLQKGDWDPLFDHLKEEFRSFQELDTTVRRSEGYIKRYERAAIDVLDQIGQIANYAQPTVQGVKEALQTIGTISTAAGSKADAIAPSSQEENPIAQRMRRLMNQQVLAQGAASQAGALAAAALKARQRT